MKIHADGIVAYVSPGFRLARFGVLRLDVFLYVFFADDMNAEGLEYSEIAVGLYRIDDILRQNLIQLLVRHIAAVHLAAALDVVYHIIELSLAQNGHLLHRRQYRVDIVGRLVRYGKRRQWRHVIKRRLALFFRRLVLLALDFGGQRIGV